jgi:DNA-binding MarR family transcriptional regulator
MRMASRRVTQLYDEALQPIGIRCTQFAILYEVNRASSPPIVMELAEMLVIERSAVGRNLRPLQRDGIVAVVEDSADARRSPVKLTAKGKRLFEQALVLWQQAQVRFKTAYGEKYAAKLRTDLLGIASDERLEAFAQD